MSEGHRTPALTGEQIDHVLQAMADSFGQQLRLARWPTREGGYEPVERSLARISSGSP